MKHMFQLIPRGSYNTIMRYTCLEKKMRKSYLILLLLAILVTSTAFGQVKAGISLSSQYVKPGDSIELVFQGSPESNFTVTIRNSRNILENGSHVFDETGQYTWLYTVNETSATDSYLVLAAIDGTTETTGFVVSGMEPSQLANTLRTMADNSKRQAQTALIEAKRKGNLNTDMVVAHQNALQALEDASRYSSQGEHTKSFESIRKAMNLFQSILDDYYRERNPPEKPVDDTDLLRAKEAIRALRKTLTKLNNTSDNLKRKGFNVEVLEKGIENMNSEISTAEATLETGSFDEAVLSIQEATQIKSRIQDALKNRLQELNKPKVQTYQDSLLKRYSAMKNTLTAIQTVDSDRITLVITNLDAIEFKLDQARNLITAGNYPEGIRALQSTDLEFKMTFSQLNGNRTQTLLNSLDKLSLDLERETSLVNKERIQLQMDTIKNRLRTRLQVRANTTTRPPVRKTPATNTPSATP